MFCGTTGFLAAFWLTAAVATTAIHAEQGVEQLEPIASASQAHAKHERSNDQFQFHRTTSPLRVKPRIRADPRDLIRGGIKSFRLSAADACPTRWVLPALLR
jgi:hypothetical protein